ncbi:Endoprotease bli-4 [Chionoecetes opilio]|uniref:Endoprotease bli-4 n=1 Tax=Chionoecetes opilio TaxID=41210 RepID=A0A8J5CE25_CHIOP|nr:Endoprotease bli-4 [Chionoecetes opilio]
MVSLPARLLVAVLSLAGRAAGAVKGLGDPLWAAELLSTDEAVARSVAADLGMVVAGRVFNNVFLMRGRGSDLNDVLPKSENERLRHRLIVWSERQIGRRRSSGARKTEPAWIDTNEVDEYTRGDDTNWSEKLVTRYMRDVGGLDRALPKSPWDLLMTKDPLRWRQWYLEAGGGMHLNVTGLWEADVKGAGVSVTVLDDGVELTHLDLALNYDPAASWDLLDADPDPTPVPWSRHGTQLAGIIAATHHNGMCGMGVAPWSGVGAVRMLGYLVWDVTEAAALSYEREHVDVYVAAWGPVDTGTVMEGPGVLASRAMAEGVVLGRGGRGSIYVWASGNGGLVGDDCNADGYSNSLYTLTVSGSTRGGYAPEYAETCAATFVSTYSGDADEDYDPEEEQVNGIVTTDTGGVCTQSFRGSSVSAALVAGVCALAIDVNPRLTWRDMQHLMVRAAAPHNPMPSQWSTNGVGIRHSHYFGFGSLDGGKMVELARSWKSVPPAFQCRLHASLHDLPLTSSQTLVMPLSVRGCQVVQTEHVQVNLSVSARSRGQVEVVLESPSGTKSTLLPRRPLDLSPYGIYDHPLLTVHMWGEDPRGTWKLHFTYHGDGILEPFGGKRLVNISNTLHNWTLIIHGTEIPIGQATPHHYYYNASQLSSLHLEGSDNITLPEDVTRVENPSEEAEEVRIETQHWNSHVMASEKILSYLFCFVHATVPSAVSSVTWQRSDGAPVDHVVRRLHGRGPQAAQYPSLLLVREVETTVGNFTCRVRHGGDELLRTIEVTAGHSSVPEVTEVTQVSVEGGTAVLPCPGLAPILRPTWVFEGRRLRPSKRVVVGERELTIRDVAANDLGVYRCQVKSVRFDYSHTTLVTLLPARGPTTLITHYALTTHPKPAPIRGSSCNNTSLDVDENQGTTTVAKVEAYIDCPSPFERLMGHCVLLAPGEARSWQKARSQCRGFKGDLLVIENAALLLALMRLIHSQDLANSSFWVGGERRSDRWQWVSGDALTPGGPLWYPSPGGGPREVPPLRHYRRHSYTSGSTGSRRSANVRHVRQKGTLRRISSARSRRTPRFSRQQDNAPPPVPVMFARRPWPLETPVNVKGNVQVLLPKGFQSFEPEGRDSSSKSQEHPREDEARKRDGMVLKEGARHGAGQDPGRSPSLAPAGHVAKLGSVRSHDEELPAADPPKESAARFKATCLWAKLGHFLASCWAGTRLRALCQYRPGALSSKGHTPS